MLGWQFIRCFNENILFVEYCLCKVATLYVIDIDIILSNCPNIYTWMLCSLLIKTVVNSNSRPVPTRPEESMFSMRAVCKLTECRRMDLQYLYSYAASDYNSSFPLRIPSLCSNQELEKLDRVAIYTDLADDNVYHF